MSKDKPDTETLDKLYLEWSQFTGARNSREVHNEKVMHFAEEALMEARECIRLKVDPKERPDGIFDRIQNALYGLRGRRL